MAVAAICTLADLLLIAAAIAGADLVVALLPKAASIGAWGAAAFALAYACISLTAASRRPSFMPTVLNFPAHAVAAALALSLLNPQAYIEMVTLVGGFALRYPTAERMLFAIGVALVSPLWFFGLVFGGRRLAGLFASPFPRNALDLGVGLLMLALAVAIVSVELGWR